MRKYTLNQDVFEHPNVLNSYWAGFIAADGCVYRDELIVALNNQDKNHLQQLADDMESNRPLRQARIDLTELRAYSKKLLSDLNRNFFIGPRKTHILMPPTHLIGDNMLSYIVGYIDGDGSIYKEDDKYLALQVTGNESMLSWIKDVFDELDSNTFKGKSLAKLYYYKNKRSCNYRVKGRRAVNVARHLMGLDIPYLLRKWSKV